MTPTATLLSAAVAVLIADQSTKVFAINRLPGRDAPPRFFLLRRVLNHHGCGASRVPWPLMVTLWLAEVAALVVFVESGLVFTSVWAQIALGVALGGATGNLFDRIWRRSVVDFIDLRVWPVFNLADTAIVAGAVIAVLSVI
jgi:signal peptidase II